MKPFWLSTVIIVVMLPACAGAAPIQTIQPTQAVSASPNPTYTLTATPASTLTPSPTATPSMQVHQSMIEVVTDNAATGDGANSWGGHQTRIVHTKDGVFTAYTVDGGGQFSREWRLVERQADGTWPVIAHGITGRDPVNLLASPDGTLNIVGWPDGYATLWSGKPENGTVTMTSTRIPIAVQENVPYSSAGIDKDGDLCVFSSSGGNAPGGIFYWACYQPSKGKWTTQTSNLDYRYCYTYVFPGTDGQLSLVSTRDVLWQVLGYKQPAGAFNYVFNAFRYWRTNDIVSKPIQVLSYADEVPNDKYSDVYLDAQSDAYLDTQNRMHILYTVNGSSTNGSMKFRHRIVSPDGTVVFDGEIPQEAGPFERIFQDAEERFYLLGSSGLLYPMDQEGETLGHPFVLDLGRDNVEYSGFGLSVPRTGTPLSNVMDVVYPSANGSAWLYFQLDFSPSSSLPVSLVQQSSNSLLSTPSPASMQEMLSHAQVLFNADLNDPALPGWDWWANDRSALSNKNGSWIITGRESSGPQVHSQYGLNINEACLAELSYSGDPGFMFQAVSGDSSDTSWRSWGITEGTDSSSSIPHLQVFYQDIYQQNSYQPLGLQDFPGRLYELLLWVNGPASFTVRAWEKDNPDTFAEHQLIMSDPENWSGRRWNCDLLVNSGIVEVDSYQELRFNQVP